MRDEVHRTTRIAAYGVVTSGPSLLVCRMAGQTAFAGLWTLPGGGIEFGEAPSDAVIRECREETGLEVKLVGPLVVVSDCVQNSDCVEHTVRIVYRVSIVSGTLRAERNGSTDLCAWRNREELSGLRTVPMVSRVLELGVI